MLTKEGMLVALEVTTNKIYHKVSIGFIEGFSGYNDERLEKNVPLLSATEWCTAMADCDLHIRPPTQKQTKKQKYLSSM